MNRLTSRFVLWAVLVALLALGVARTSRAACHMEQAGAYPVAVHGRRALVTGQVNGTDETFIINSGSFFSSLHKAVATELKVPLGAPDHGGFGGGNFQVARVKDFTIFSGTLHDLQFITLDSDAPAGAVAGVIGQNFLRIMGDAEYDFAHGALRFWQTSGCSRDQMAYWVKGGDTYSMLDIQSTTARNALATGKAYLNGVPIHVWFATGTPVSVLSLRAAARAGVKPGDPGVTSAPDGTWIAPFASFKIGDEDIRNTQLRISDLGYDSIPLAYGARRVPLSVLNFGDEVDMVLGFDFFLSHRVLVSDAHHKVYFSYNGGPIFDVPGRRGSTPDAQAR